MDWGRIINYALMVLYPRLVSEITGKRVPGTPVEFHGWIPANEEDRELLVNLGIGGKMIWRERDNSGSSLYDEKLGAIPHLSARSKAGIFEYCTIKVKDINKLDDYITQLITRYPAFAPNTFTGVRQDHAQTIYQPLWRWSKTK